ncbi:MAG: hypothetical protein N2109_04935 [Fimbriimonadales bacterium]|nr:hypothetical protein [Fimbriimonadales bacterium]
MTQRLCTVAALAAFGTAAFAQGGLDVTPTNLAVRGGGFLPFDDELNDFSEGFAGIGIDIFFPQQYLPNSRTYLSIDWLGKSATGSKGNFFPICLNQRFSLGKAEEGQPGSYFFVGVGATVFDFYSTNTQFGARAGIGIDLGPHVFAEGTFFWSDTSTGGIDGTGIGVYLGYRW